MSNAPVLAVSQLNAWYGAAHILFDVSLEIGRGEVVALMGRNGAGKSTTLKAIMGLLERRTGRVAFQGSDISALEPYQVARASRYVRAELALFVLIPLMAVLMARGIGTQAAP